eukprot:1930366-Pyramimonas_sp.AAC.1
MANNTGEQTQLRNPLAQEGRNTPAKPPAPPTHGTPTTNKARQNFALGADSGPRASLDSKAPAIPNNTEALAAAPAVLTQMLKDELSRLQRGGRQGGEFFQVQAEASCRATESDQPE